MNNFKNLFVLPGTNLARFVGKPMGWRGCWGWGCCTGVTGLLDLSWGVSARPELSVPLPLELKKIVIIKKLFEGNNLKIIWDYIKLSIKK